MVINYLSRSQRTLAGQSHFHTVLNILFALFLIFLFSRCTVASKEIDQQNAIRVNQVGYLPVAEKQAIVVNPGEEKTFSIQDESGDDVYSGKLSDQKYWDKSDENVAIADFSDFEIPGKYSIKYGDQISHTFQIKSDLYFQMLKAAIKSYYFNRMSTELEEEYAGKFKRPFSHPDTAVYVHASAASENRPAGTKISTPYGWYDAGDYNKYIVNSGITTYTLLLAYQNNKALYDSLSLNIPESGNNYADLLDEILWNIKWMETMQDPNDGGVYHKTTTANFEGFVFPPDATNKRYVVTKGTAAALDFSAVLAKAAVILKDKNPDYSEELLKKSERAWKWAVENPAVLYKNPTTNDENSPSIVTGEYGDSNVDDEFFWAACELYLATGNKEYRKQINFDNISSFGVPNWGSVESLGIFSLASIENNQSKDDLKRKASEILVSMANELVEYRKKSPYSITINEFRWGSNSDVLNQGMVLLNAYKVKGNKEFYNSALSGLDYVLGKNAVGYSFVTGYGSVTPQHIHHRQSASDEIDQPIPGFLAGGPNPRNASQDCGEDKYPSLLPAKAFVDDVCSYSTNEVAINWNAPLVYVTGELQSIYLVEEVN